MTDEYIGIDYDMGKSNRDPQNMEMHYGVISGNKISSWSLNETLEADYGKATCPKCGNEAKEPEENSYDEDTEQEDLDALKPYSKYDCFDYICENCEIYFSSEHAYPEEPIGHTYESEDLIVSLDSDNDVWILKSPYYTLCAYCSPCAPGAGDLAAQREHGIKSYCLPLDWFDAEDDTPCPYKIYQVSDDTLVYDPNNADDIPTVCPRCGEESLRSTFYVVRDLIDGDIEICESCAEEYLVVCKFCEKKEAEHIAHLHQNGHVCSTCWDERLRSTA